MIFIHRRVQRGGVRGPDPPFSWTPPFSSVTPRPTQPDLTDKCNVNCFLIVYYAVKDSISLILKVQSTC